MASRQIKHTSGIWMEFPSGSFNFTEIWYSAFNCRNQLLPRSTVNRIESGSTTNMCADRGFIPLFGFMSELIYIFKKAIHKNDKRVSISEISEVPMLFAVTVDVSTSKLQTLSLLNFKWYSFIGNFRSEIKILQHGKQHNLTLTWLILYVTTGNTGEFFLLSFRPFWVITAPYLTTACNGKYKSYDGTSITFARTNKSIVLAEIY